MTESKGKIGKYLRYSFGELVLLVMGILLALQINNCNDGRINKNELNTILSIIHTDLTSNIQEADKLIAMYTKEVETLNRMFDSTQSESVIQNCNLCYGLNTSFADLVLRKRGLELLKNYKSQHSVSSDSLIIKVDAFYQTILKYNTVMVDLINLDVLDNLKYYRDHFDWYGDFVQGKMTDEIAQDIMSNTLCRNRLLHYRVLIEANYLRLMEGFKVEGEVIQEELRNRIN